MTNDMQSCNESAAICLLPLVGVALVAAALWAVGERDLVPQTCRRR